MNAMVDLLSGPTWQHLALALLHTLWQGLAAAVLLWLLLRRIPADRPEARYWTAFSILTGLVLCGLVTWSVLDFQWPTGPASAGSKTCGAAVPAAPAGETPAPPLVLDRSLSSALANGDGAENRPVWLAFLVAGWLAGVALMAARMAWMVGRSRRLARGPEIEDGRVRLLIEGLRQSLGVTRRFRIVETAEEFGPAVLGVLRPILVMPLSMMTGLPPEALRAILAHELAHVRRHDYLLNLVQMVIEAVLFFNPAVWWISRQIRIEREACCDAMAASILGEPLALAEALSLWAERTFARRDLAAAFASSGRHGPRLLLDRVRRILLPGYRPQMPVSPVGFLGFFAAAVMVLCGLSFGTSAALELAAKVLTPAERMERIVETQQQYAPPKAVSPQGKVTLSGKIRTRGGEPVPKNVRANTRTRTNNCTSFVSHGAQSPNFSITAGAGKTWLQFTSEGYAPAIVGPFNGKSGETISGIEVFLDRGFAQTVAIVDEKGKPVEDAKVQGSPFINNGSIGSAYKLRTTDAKGVATFPHAIESNCRFRVRKAGFQPIEATLPVKPQQPLTLTLAHAQPLQGIVLSSAGQPVDGAEIRQYAKFALVGNMLGKRGPVMAVTNAKGRFVLDELEDGVTYALLIVTKEQGWHLVREVTAKQNDLRIEIGPELIVSGTIHGDLGKLTKKNGKPVITYGQCVSFLSHRSENCQGGSTPVEAIDGGGKFTIRGLLPGEVTITAADHIVRTTVEPSAPRQQVTIDLTKPVTQLAQRQIVMRFATPDDAIPPEGTIQVYVLDSVDACGPQSKIVPLEKGEARFEAYAPGPLIYKPKGLLGYWFEAVHTPRIEPGEAPLEITVPVVPAGAIAGQVLNSDGTPAIENISMGVTGKYVSPTATRYGGFVQENINDDAKGRFFASPLPLGGTFTVTVQRGHTVQVSSPIQLDATHPMVKLTLRLPPTAAVEGQVLDPDRRPMARFAFSLGFSPPKGRGEKSWGGNLATDREGRFRIADLGVGVGKYSLTSNPRRDYRLLRVPLPLDGKPVTVQLQRGLVLEGQLVDDATGRPIMDAEMTARPSPFQPGDFVYNAEDLTDEGGRFRFSNLDDRQYRISNRSGLQSAQPGEPTSMPGKKPIILRVTVPEGSPLKPQPNT